MKNNPRKCIVTNELHPKEEMIRIVKTKQGQILVNSDAKGRGAYVVKNKDHIQKIRKNRLLNRVFRVNVKEDVYAELEKVLNN